MTNTVLPRVVCILGSPRSGTSALAHLVNEMGVYLGPRDHLQMETTWNPDGCWEHIGFLNLNIALLNAFGGLPAYPPTFPTGWERDAKLKRVRSIAEEMIRTEFADRPLWGWKDPATCSTLPFWQQLIGEMRYIICVRNPVDVAASVEKWRQRPFPVAVNGWIDNMLGAVLQTAGAARLFFSFDDYFANPDLQIARLAEFIGEPTPERGGPDYARVSGVIRTDLKRFQSPVDKVVNDDRLTTGDKYFYLSLLEACQAPIGEDTLDLLGLLNAYRGASRERYQRLQVDTPQPAEQAAVQVPVTA